MTRRLAHRAAAPARAAGPVLVVSAFEPELAPLRRALRSLPRLARHVHAEPVGIGPVEAAVGAARAIARVRPGAVIFLGTAGSYARTPALAIGRAALARRIVLASAAVAGGEGYRPAVMPAEVETDAHLRALMTAAVAARRRQVVLVLPTADVATPTAITRSAALARRLAAATRAGLENLEAFAVARAAAAAGVPFAALLGVSNQVGPDAHHEWRRHAARATRAATGILLLALPALLAPATPSPAFIKAPSRRSTGTPRPVPPRARRGSARPRRRA